MVFCLITQLFYLILSKSNLERDFISSLEVIPHIYNIYILRCFARHEYIIIILYIISPSNTHEQNDTGSRNDHVNCPIPLSANNSGYVNGLSLIPLYMHHSPLSISESHYKSPRVS